MGTRPELQPCLKRCLHCGIVFLTHPRNAKRNDLRCPFGCREEHRKRCSTERSVAYYRTKEGKFKKKIQNDKRSRAEPAPEREKRPEEEEKPAAAGTPAGSGLGAAMVSYVRLATSLIEGRRVGRDEILAMLARVVRQHSLARRKKIDYLLWYLNRHPP